MEFVRSLVSACSCLMGSLLFQIIGHGPQQSKGLEFKLHFGNHCHCKTSCRKVNTKKNTARKCASDLITSEVWHGRATGCFTSCRTCFCLFLNHEDGGGGNMVSVGFFGKLIDVFNVLCGVTEVGHHLKRTPIRRFSGEHFLVFLAIHLGNSQRHCHGERTSEDLR